MAGDPAGALAYGRRALTIAKGDEGALRRLLNLCDPLREREVIERACRANPGPLDERAIVKIFRLIILESKRVEANAMEMSGKVR